LAQLKLTLYLSTPGHPQVLVVFEHLLIAQAISYGLSYTDANSAESLKAGRKITFKCVEKFALQALRKAMVPGLVSESYTL